MIDDQQMAQLSARFRKWGVLAAELGSPLYARLSAEIADDPALLALSAQKASGQPPENMLFAAVHYLLQADRSAPLSAFYPDLVAQPLSAENAFPAFRAFCLERRAAILALLQTRMTQTNAVRRCTFLLPAFLYVSHLLAGQPLAQIEVGCSAGLNLHWDKFHYRYGEMALGNEQSTVQLGADLRGDRLPPGGLLPPVFGRIGVDLNPLDVRNPDDVAWLNALIWPEHSARRSLLQAAIALAQQQPVAIVRGDGVAQIGALAERFPPEVPLLVYHSFVMYQLSADMRSRFLLELDHIAQTRTLYCIDAGQHGTDTAELQLYSWQNGERSKLKLATMDPHGRWLRWLV